MNRKGTFRALAYIVIALGLTAASRTVEAGGFAVREQSTYGLSTAFAGMAAGGDLSSIFWNPAGVSIARGIEVEADGALVIPDTQLHGATSLDPVASLKPILGPSVPLSFLDANGGGFADPAFIPAFYVGMPVNDRLSIGGGFNGPFGITTEPDNDNWAGKFEARSSKLSTYNLNPVMSYRMTSSLVVGAGAQFEFADTALKSAFPAIGGLAGLNPNVVIKGDSFGLGYTLGALWRPSTGTDIGLGFRSSIEHALEGESFVAGDGALGKAKISADLEMPSIVTASIRQKAGERLTLLGTIEWTNWSELEQVVVRARTNNPDLGASAGDLLTALPFHWHDGWLFAGGAEFAATERTTLRAGTAWEVSPVQNATERLVRVPDTDRTWLSVGATYMLSPMTSVDLAYSHVFFADGAIDRASAIPGLGQARLVAEAKQDIDILGLSIKVKLGRAGSPLPSP